MSRRRLEALLWACALTLALVAWVRWRRAEPEAQAPPSALTTAPAPPRRVTERALQVASNTVVQGNPFRLDRAPAPVPFSADPNAVGGMPMAPPPPPPVPRPPLAVSGIVGPPWQALLEGVPGRSGPVLVKAGDRLGELRVRSVTRDLVVVQGADTTWRLPLKRTWQ